MRYRKELSYACGDHIAVCPANQEALVDRVLNHLQDAPSADMVVRMEYQKQRNTPLGKTR